VYINRPNGASIQAEREIKMALGGIDKKLLNLVQTEFPLQPRPYRELGLKLGIDSADVMQRIKQLRAKDIVRQISPVLDARSLGYQVTLVAMKVAENQLAQAAQVIQEHPGISHGYQRTHNFNLWFTLAMPPATDMETELKRLATLLDTEDAFTLPAIKLFKISAYFALAGDGLTTAATTVPPGGTLPRQAELSPTDRLVINKLQQDLPLMPAPFAAMAAQLGMDEEVFLACCRSLLKRRIMRRFSASINQRKAGFKANAMACWIAPPDKVDAAGQQLASLGEVSHCYERKTNQWWRYNLFAMIHGRSREVCQLLADQVSREAGLRDYILLYSTREFKKTRVKYTV